MATRALPTLRPPRRRRDFDATERGLTSPIEMRRARYKALYWGVVLLLLLLALTTFVPLFWLFTGALKPTQEFFRRPPTILPENPDWSNYQTAWDRLNYARYFGNTLAIAFGAWLIQMLVTTTAAFSLSKLQPAFGRLLLFLFFSTIMVPGAILLVPRYLVVADMPIFHISLLQSWWAIWLPGAVNGFGIFLLKTFFDNVPVDLTDAATIDGANAWQLFWQIVLPLSKSALAVLTIGTVIASWQDFFWPFLVLTGAPELNPIMVALNGFAGGANGRNPLNLVIAGSAIAAVPPIILFLIFQRQIIRGINLTGLQG
jgi:multiple sugar transport system permease protein